MTRVLIVGAGTVALDTVETPEGSATELPGGSALYFAAAASAHTPVAVVGVTGEDFPAEPLDRLRARGVDVSGIERRPHPTFRWHARYDVDGNRETLSAHRGGIVKEVPRVPAALRDPGFLFLGSTDPSVQASLLAQSGEPGCVVLDTMPHWIEGGRARLEAVLARVDVLLVNGEEARLLGGHDDEAGAAEAVRALGPRWVVVKRGAHGAGAYGPSGVIEIGAERVARVVDPTGAGDAFAGGLVAALAARGGFATEALEEALEVGTAMGALAVSAFGLEGLFGSGRPGG